IAAAALRESASDTAKSEARALAADARDPLVRTLLAAIPTAAASASIAPSASSAPSAPAGSGTLSGELVSPPRGPVALVLLGTTGLLAVFHLARLVARFALRYRRPAELVITAGGLTLRTKTELLGRVVREQETQVPISALLEATREIRYPRLGLYAGLVSLALGSYFGVSLFVDGARAGSPELLGIGLLLVAVGVVLDYLLENVMSGSKGKCRVVIVPRKGPRRAIGDLDPARADAALARLTHLARVAR
ncbi:MAG: hypothetical protein ABI193_06800, partial [Minicystis sp.]